MESHESLLGVTERQTLDFFYTCLKDATPPALSDSYEMLYVASILAHHAQVSIAAHEHIPIIRTVRGSFGYHIILHEESRQSVELLESAGAQIFVYVGLYPENIKLNVHLRLYKDLGKGCFYRAAKVSRYPKRTAILLGVASRFEEWATTAYRMRTMLDESRYLLSVPPHI